MRIKKPCSPRCSGHVSHPCERCGQQFGEGDHNIALYMFWKKTPLTQWSRHGFKDGEGNQFNCAEQFMMWKKANMFRDFDIAWKIMKETSPANQQKLGRQVKNFDIDKWNKYKATIVTRGNYFKFSQDEDLKQFLLRTGNDILIEASPYDRVWGIGYSEEHALKNVDDWGENLLGKCLMEVRELLKLPF